MGKNDSVNELEYAKQEIAALRSKLDENDRRIKELGATNARLREECAACLTGLERVHDDQKSLDQIKSDFLALVSHELRTPLTAVLGYTDLVLRGLGGELTSKQDHYLRTSLVSAKELLGLVNNMIEYSSLEAGLEDVQLASFDLSEAIESALAPLMAIAVDKSLIVVNEANCSLPPVKGDGHKFRRALECILSNAIKFTPPRGSITLKACVDGSSVIISVADTGTGIPADKLDHIWERFYQVDSSPTRKYGGLGLGLSIAKKLVEMQGGRIWLRVRALTGAAPSL